MPIPSWGLVRGITQARTLPLRIRHRVRSEDRITEATPRPSLRKFTLRSLLYSSVIMLRALDRPNLTAHGTRVLMTNHPATSQLDCFYKTEYWQAQSGTEYCIFCILPWKGCHRCPGCEAVACIGCFKAIAKRESGGGRARPASFHYTPSGG